jgi:hypothetical protein
MVIQPQFYAAQAFSEGLAAVAVKAAGSTNDPLLGFIDKTGRLVIPAQFTSTKEFSEGLCWVTIRKDGQKDISGFIDKTGTWVIKSDKAGPIGIADFSEGVALTLVDNKYSIIDQTGKVIAQLPAGMTGAGPDGFNEGLAPVQKILSDTPKQGFIDKTGAVVINLQYDYVSGFTEGLALAGMKDNGVMKYGYIDKAGAWVIMPQFSAAYRFTEGLGAVGTLIPGRSGELPADTLFSFIDKTGKVVIKLQQGQVPSGLGFAGGVAGFDTFTNAGDLVPHSRTYIDTTGKVIWQDK